MNEHDPYTYKVGSVHYAQCDHCGWKEPFQGMEAWRESSDAAVLHEMDTQFPDPFDLDRDELAWDER